MFVVACCWAFILEKEPIVLLLFGKIMGAAKGASTDRDAAAGAVMKMTVYGDS